MRFDPANPDRLTERLKHVFRKAESIALERGADDISPEDLLLALARRDRGVGRSILERLSIQVDLLQEDIAALAPRREVGPSRPAALGFSPAALRVIALAKEEAAALRVRYLGTEFLVLGLLCDEVSRAGAFLRERSASVERAREALDSVLYD